MWANLKLGRERQGTRDISVNDSLGKERGSYTKGSEFKMSKEEIRSKWELCTYDGHNFEDSPPDTKKAKYQPGKKSPYATHVLLQVIFVTACTRRHEERV